jgi:hypothetical protein
MMASRGQSWFDPQKLLSGEELVRSGVARVRTDTPPYWWEGELILTSDRLFFLPRVENPFLGRVAFWLHDVIDTGPAGRNRLHVRTTDDAALFHIVDAGPAALAGLAGARWLSLIDTHRRGARPAAAFERDPRSRRAAG